MPILGKMWRDLEAYGFWELTPATKISLSRKSLRGVILKKNKRNYPELYSKDLIEMQHRKTLRILELAKENLYIY